MANFRAAMSTGGITKVGNKLGTTPSKVPVVEISFEVEPILLIIFISVCTKQKINQQKSRLEEEQKKLNRNKIRNQFKQVEINITKIGYSNGKELSNKNQRNGSLKANEIG